MRLVLVSTSGNQAFVFASNRLREAVGASYLILRATTTVVQEQAQAVGAQVLQCSSGSALLTVATEADARAVVTAVTTRALTEAPGLTVLGVHLPMAGENPSPGEIETVYRLWQRHAAEAAGAVARWPRLPVVAACASTDAPAASWHADVPPRRGRYLEAERPQPLSAPVVAKRQARRAADRRVNALLAGTRDGAGLGLVGTATLFEGAEWAAVVHADANRLGRFFLDSAAVLPGLQVDGTAVSMAQLSAAVQHCAEEAFGTAVARVAGLVGRTAELPVVPLVIGGDDLTALVDGRYALGFTTAYLDAFGAAAGADPVIGAVAAALPDRRVMTVSAGIAVVKPHFPFSAAYQLAAELCDNAKRLAGEHPSAHALDVHVLLDSTFADVERIRRRYLVRDGDQEVLATARPFLLPATEGVAVPPEREWTSIAARLGVVRDTPIGADGRVVTRTQLHQLRTELRRDLTLAQRRLTQLQHQATDEQDKALLHALAGTPATVRTPGGVVPVLDLLELADFALLEVAQ